MYKPYDIDALRKQLTRFEARKTHLYKDSVGKWTVGVGWNIDDKGLPEPTIDMLLDIGIEEAERGLDQLIPSWRMLKAIHQRVLLDMCFNMGVNKLGAFKQMLVAVENYIKTGNKDWVEEWAKQMQASKWYSQVGIRAEELQRHVRTNA
jgi:lysozyme